MGSESSTPSIKNSNNTSDKWSMMLNYNHRKLWRNSRTGQEVEQLQVRVNNIEQVPNFKNSIKLRYNSSVLVAVKYFKQQKQYEMCSMHYKGSLFIQNIVLKLNQISQIPFPDILHLYDQMLRGFQQLAFIHGFFHVDEQLVCINDRAQVKVWCNSNLSKNKPQAFLLKNQLTQKEMVLNIIKIIDANTNKMELKFDVSQILVKNYNQLGFVATIKKLQEIVARNQVSIPKSLSSVSQLLEITGQADPFEVIKMRKFMIDNHLDLQSQQKVSKQIKEGSQHILEPQYTSWPQLNNRSQNNMKTTESPIVYKVNLPLFHQKNHNQTHKYNYLVPRNLSLQQKHGKKQKHNQHIRFEQIIRKPIQNKISTYGHLPNNNNSNQSKVTRSCHRYEKIQMVSQNKQKIQKIINTNPKILIKPLNLSLIQKQQGYETIKTTKSKDNCSVVPTAASFEMNASLVLNNNVLKQERFVTSPSIDNLSINKIDADNLNQQIPSVQSFRRKLRDLIIKPITKTEQFKKSEIYQNVSKQTKIIDASSSGKVNIEFQAQVLEQKIKIREQQIQQSNNSHFQLGESKTNFYRQVQGTHEFQPNVIIQSNKNQASSELIDSLMSIATKRDLRQINSFWLQEFQSLFCDNKDSKQSQLQNQQRLLQFEKQIQEQTNKIRKNYLRNQENIGLFQQKQDSLFQSTAQKKKINIDRPRSTKIVNRILHKSSQKITPSINHWADIPEVGTSLEQNSNFTSIDNDLQKELTQLRDIHPNINISDSSFHSFGRN